MQRLYLPVISLIILFTTRNASGAFHDILSETHHQQPAAVNVVLGGAELHAATQPPLYTSITHPTTSSSDAVSQVLQHALSGSQAIKQQEELGNQQKLDHEQSQRDATRRLEIAEAEKALNLAIERDLQDKHELHQKEEEVRHLRRKANIRQENLRKNERERLNALEDEEAQLEEENIGLDEAEKRAEEEVEDMKKNLDEVVEQAKEKENHDIKQTINKDKKKHMRSIQRHPND